MNRLVFAKMHGLGNDFMVIDARSQPLELSAEQIRNMADRHRGIGFDQLLAVAPPPDRSGADYRYLIYNSDGSEAEQCGNGARCMTLFLKQRGALLGNSVRLWTPRNLIDCHLLPDQRVRVEMGVPDFSHASLPMDVTVDGLSRLSSIDFQLMVSGLTLQLVPVSMGNPHAVVKMEDVARANLEILGEELQLHPTFPHGVNLGLVRIMSRHALELRVFERGAGETLSCGSGACAAAAVAIRKGWATSPVTVYTRGGALEITWDGSGVLSMTGPATEVFVGEIVL